MPNSTASDLANPSVPDRLVHLAVLGLLGLLRALPSPLALRLAQALGRTSGWVVHRWGQIADSNLQRALPELSSRDRKEIIRGVFRNLGRVVFALAKVPHWSPDQIRRQVDFVGLEHFREGVARGRGVLLLTAHLGSWELGALAHGAVESPVHVMVRPLDNRLVNRTVESLRQAHGNRVIGKRKAAREVLRILRANGTVGILADQNAAEEEAVFVEFFGIKTAANKGFAQLALRSGAAVIPAVAWWNPSSGRHVVEYGPRIEVIVGNDRSSDIQSNTQRFQSALESRIRRHPDQWLWFHRRWKTKPKGHAGPDGP